MIARRWLVAVVLSAVAAFCSLPAIANASRAHDEVALASINVSGNYQPLSGDFNCDGVDDVVWYAPGANDDFVWFGSAAGDFASRAITIYGEYLPAVGDLNGDACSDILWYDARSGVATEWIGNSSRSFTEGRRLRAGVAYTPIVGDFDGNGRADIAWYRPGPDADSLWLNDPGGSHRVVPLAVNGLYIATVVDANGDGKADIIYAAVDRKISYLAYGSVSGRFSSHVIQTPRVATRGAAGDFNGDGRDDVVFHASPHGGADEVWYSTTDVASFSRVQMTVFDPLAVPVSGRFNAGVRSDVLWYSPGKGSESLWFDVPRDLRVPVGHGAARWLRFVDGASLVSTALDSANAYVSRSDGTLEALRRGDGLTAWVRTVPGSCPEPRVFHRPSRILVVCGSKLHVYTASGTRITTIGSFFGLCDSTASPTSLGVVTASAGSYAVDMYDTATMHRRWTRASVHDRCAMVASVTISFGSGDGDGQPGVEVVNTSDGRGRFITPSGFLIGASSRGTVALCADDNSHASAYSIDGARRWTRGRCSFTFTGTFGGIAFVDNQPLVVETGSPRFVPTYPSDLTGLVRIHTSPTLGLLQTFQPHQTNNLCDYISQVFGPVGDSTMLRGADVFGTAMISAGSVPVLLPHAGTCTSGRLGAWDMRSSHVRWATSDSITLHGVAVTDASDPSPVATGLASRDDHGNLVLLNV